MNSANSSDAYKSFLDFFTLTGRQRLEGLDRSCFSGMTLREREAAFDFLKDRFHVSEESIRGMYLCDEKKAISEFTEAVKLPAPENVSTREIDNFYLCKSIMLNYICQNNLSAYNIDMLASIGNSNNEDVRAYVYQSLPSMPTTGKALELLKSAVFTETSRPPLSSAISKLMEIYGYKTSFDPSDLIIKNLYLRLRSGNSNTIKSAINDLEENFTPIFVD